MRLQSKSNSPNKQIQDSTVLERIVQQVTAKQESIQNALQAIKAYGQQGCSACLDCCYHTAC